MRPALLAAACLAAAPAAAADYSDGVQGQEAVQLIQQALAASGLPAAAMPAPVRALPSCGHAPSVAPRQGDWSSAVLRCDSPRPWTRTLRTGSPGAMAPPRPTGAPAPPPGARQALVLAHPLPRGALVTADDLAEAPLAGLSPAQALVDPRHAVGRRLRVALGAGQPLLDRHLDPAFDVEEGRRVALVVKAGAVEIATQAEALESARSGERVRVRNASSGRIVEATVIGRDRVRAEPKMR